MRNLDLEILGILFVFLTLSPPARWSLKFCVRHHSHFEDFSEFFDFWSFCFAWLLLERACLYGGRPAFAQRAADFRMMGKYKMGILFACLAPAWKRSRKFTDQQHFGKLLQHFSFSYTVWGAGPREGSRYTRRRGSTLFAES